MTRGPTLTPRLGLPQEIACVAQIVELDVWQRGNPGIGVREAHEHGDQTAFAPHHVLGVLSPCDRTPRFLETPNEEFRIMMGTRQSWRLQVLQQRGRPCHRDLLNVSTHVQACVLRTVWSKGGHKLPQWRWRFLAAWFSVQAVGKVVQPTETPDSLCKCLLNARPHGAQACSSVQQGGRMWGHAPFHRRRHARPRLIQLHSGRLERILPLVPHDRAHGRTSVFDPLGCLGRQLYRRSRNLSAPTHRLVPLFRHRTARFTDLGRAICHSMTMANPRRDHGEPVGNRPTDRFWLITAASPDRHPSAAPFCNHVFHCRSRPG